MEYKNYEKKGGFYNAPAHAEKIVVYTSAAAGQPNVLGSGPKMSCLVSPAPTEDETTLLVQMGVSHCFTWINEEHCSISHLSELRKTLSDRGLCLFNVGNRLRCKSKDIILATPDRDAAIAKFVEWLEILSAAGINTTTFTWEPDGVWSTGESTVRGNTKARAVDAAILPKDAAAVASAVGSKAATGSAGSSASSSSAASGAISAEASWQRKVKYEEEELWANLEYFLGQVLPHAARLGVRLALHPNDPPVPSVAGVPCLIRSREAYERVFRIAKDSPWLGMEFCCGCWLEGGKGFGDLEACLADYCRRGKVFIVHLRNVTGPLPKFAETFIDEGYGDIHAICGAMTSSGYSGTVILDHTPEFVESAGPAAASAFAIGYIKGTLRACQAAEQKSREVRGGGAEGGPPSSDDAAASGASGGSRAAVGSKRARTGT